MTSLEQSRLADHLDAALAAMPAATAARLTHSDRGQRRIALTIMAQALAVRLDGDQQAIARVDAAMLPGLPIDQ